ncbi:family 1 extracellular solute-binding protein [Leptolyngbya boryana NIES-2135]|jgi:putative chitobiose transport system substrate-binding protein|uniref:Family 1 extracellular solute-binding protein n=1 Tax=Leptolyngbya boryana NIES-2135 TaxID=1973484 RepID=A0A1Z4JD56_LEPBY|nr:MULTISPECIES: sugar ABC transporter substrate-binding protein [Leptolyngbya]BAY54593.1 family 1 extracellular solute-binding protein [Leptolyngbya boryana NIES-2135]MBD2365585.1 sugar ABC transporter substrate-binding protein [Leptolyngbya sp. FACHB-161]MBD2371765.1 sugar ABC transporter substrate-binding protein [Leptolyngbya sp. FACHB-238]MBD2396190.1 sugar ABC transporter substrate-binding protein [Leptolyngbya sp. FACHB-239]MBD2402713.1 sugar ABC transporter substrate-binding protein [L
MRQSRTWKTFAIFSLLGVVLSWLVSCGGGTPNAGTSATGQIDFWTMQLSPQFDDYFKSLFAKFEQENPGVKVRWTDVPWAEMERKILTSVAAKTAPDVVNLNPGFASQLAERNAWMMLDEKIPADVKNQYFPGIWQASTLNGKTFGIPWYLTTRVAIYNTDLLKKAGITKPPATYAELAQAAKQIKEKTGKYAFFATVVPSDSGEVMESFVQMGVKLVDDQGKAAFNSPQGKAAFQYWVDLYQNGLMPKEVLTEGHRHAIDLYQQGNTAILASGAEFLKSIAKNAPTIAQASESAPQITGDTRKKNVAVMNVAIPRDTDQPDAALKFALFLTNNANQLEFAKAANVLPSTVKAAEDPYFTKLPENATGIDKARVVSAGQLKEAEVLIPVIKNIKTLQQTIYENLQAAMLKQKTVDQALSDAAQTWNARS